MTYPAMPWVVILVVSMIIVRSFSEQKINKYLEGQTLNARAGPRAFSLRQRGGTPNASVELNRR